MVTMRLTEAEAQVLRMVRLMTGQKKEQNTLGERALAPGKRKVKRIDTRKRPARVIPPEEAKRRRTKMCSCCRLAFFDDSPKNTRKICKDCLAPAAPDALLMDAITEQAKQIRYRNAVDPRVRPTGGEREDGGSRPPRPTWGGKED